MEQDSFHKKFSNSLALYTSVFQAILFFTTKIHSYILMEQYLEDDYYESEAYYFDCVLYIYGSKYAPSIKYHFQYWRLFPIFLHASFSHLICSIFIQILYGFIQEITQGWRRVVILYITGGIGASLFSCVINNYKTAVGASGSAFSLLALELVYLITPNNFSYDGRICIFFLTVFVIVLVSLDSPPQVDQVAHFGGFLVGLLISIGYAFADSLNNNMKQYQYIFYGLVGILYIYLLMKIYDDKIQDEQICKEFNIF